MNCSLYQILQTCLHNTAQKLAIFVFHLSQNCSIVKKLILLGLTPLSNILHLRALLTFYFVDWEETQHKGSHLDFLQEADTADVGVESHS